MDTEKNIVTLVVIANVIAVVIIAVVVKMIWFKINLQQDNHL